MPYSDDDLVQIHMQSRDQIVDMIREITVNPKPSYNIDGQNVEWQPYLDQLNKSLKAVNQQIIDLTGPYEFETQAYT